MVLWAKVLHDCSALLARVAKRDSSSLTLVFCRDGMHLADRLGTTWSMALDRAELRVGDWTTAGSWSGRPWRAANPRRGATRPRPVWTGVTNDLLYADDPTGAETCGARLTADLDHGGTAPGRCRHRRTAVGARHPLVQALDDGCAAVRTDGSDVLVLIDPDETERTPLDAVTRLSIEDRADVSSFRRRLGGAGLWELDVDAPDAAADRRRLAVGRGMDAAASRRHRARAARPVHAFDYPPTNSSTWRRPRTRSPRIAWFTCTAGRPPPSEVPHQDASPYADESRHRCSGCQLRRLQQRLRAGLPRAPARAMGSRRRRRMWRPPRRGLAGTGAADASRLTIAGGSAGGWTVLAALVEPTRSARASSRYGVARRTRAPSADRHPRLRGRSTLDGHDRPAPRRRESCTSSGRRCRISERLRTFRAILQAPRTRSYRRRSWRRSSDALAAHGRPARLCGRSRAKATASAAPNDRAQSLGGGSRRSSARCTGFDDPESAAARRLKPGVAQPREEGDAANANGANARRDARPRERGRAVAALFVGPARTMLMP